MTKILHIETATKICSVALSENKKCLALRESKIANSHSEMLTVFIEDIMKDTNLLYKELDAVAVSMGPGSYTGLRIGVSSAKGLCYSQDKPLISVSTLQSMAYGMVELVKKSTKNILFCPMIDARRMEVYSSLFNSQNEKVREIQAEIIDKNSFSDYFEKYTVYFAGDGAEKCKEVLSHQKNAVFLEDFQISAENMIELAYKKFKKKQIEDTAYFEPFYLKNFVAKPSKIKGLE